MRTTITKLAIAGAAGATGLLGAATTAHADVATGQVRAQAAQPMPEDDDLRVADPEGAPVRAGPGPAYEVVGRMDYGEPVQYDETTGYVEMTEEEATQIAELMAGEDIPAAMPTVEEAAEMAAAAEAAAAEMAAGQMAAGDMPSAEMPSAEMPAGQMPSSDMPSGEMATGEMATGDNTSGDSAAHDVYSEMTADDPAASMAVPAQTATTTYPAAYVIQQIANAIGPSTSESAWLNVDDGYVWLGDVEPG
ncbi:SH3 domain-containing protein [Nonomuraea rubra]|uniref:SH3 domain-containing protein n=1 Tax=Nonomuraea rubra TaxID=46180 RepID=UPI0034020100